MARSLEQAHTLAFPYTITHNHHQYKIIAKICCFKIGLIRAGRDTTLRIVQYDPVVHLPKSSALLIQPYTYVGCICMMHRTSLRKIFANSIPAHFLLLHPFAYLESAHRVFVIHAFFGIVLLLSALLSPLYVRVTSQNLSFGLPIFRCPITSFFFH